MNKITPLFFLFFILSTAIIAQPTIDWQRSLGGQRLDKINATIRTTDGGYLLIGQSASINTQGRFDTMQAALIRLNTEGGIVWQKNFGGIGYDAAYQGVELSTGGFTIVGETTNDRNKNTQDAWIFSIDDKGTLINQSILGGTGDDVFRGILLKNEALYVIGTTNSKDGSLINATPKGGKDILTAKFNNYKELLPSGIRLYGGSGDDEGRAIINSNTTDNNSIILLASTLSSNGDISNTKGSNDIWVTEINLTDGAIKWQKALGGKNEDKAADIIANPEGYLIAGTTASTEGDVKGLKGMTDIWAVQINNTGSILRQNCIGGLLKDEASAITIDSTDKTFIIIGSTESKNGYVLSQHGATDWSISKIDNTLKVKWHKCLGGTRNDNGCDIVWTKDGGLLAVGLSQSTDGNVMNGDNNGNGWVTKLNRKNLSFYDDRQLIVRFRDGFTRDSALFYQKYYKAKQINNKEEDLTCAGLMQLWQVDTFPVILPNGDTLKDIIEVADAVMGKPRESSGEPNYAFSNGLDIDSIYSTPQYPILQVYGSDSSLVLKPCERVGKDSAVILAIIDSGIDTIPTGHALHAQYLWKNAKEGAQGSLSDLDANGYKGDKIGWDFVENDAFPYDQRGHGSHVTGIIAQMLERHKSDSVKLMILKIFDVEGNSSLYSLARALTYAICNNAQVVNMSLSYTNDSQLVMSSVIKFLIEYGGNRQKLLAVAAAGNYSTDIDAASATERFCPAYFDSKNLLVVASVDPNRNLSSFSNYGKVSVDVAAAGTNVFSTLNNKKWGFLSGTSMATPFVSASAALMGVKRCNNVFDFNPIKTALENTVLTSTGLAPIRKTGFINFCAARQSFLSTLPASCLVSVSTIPESISHFQAAPNPFSQSIFVQLTSLESMDVQIVLTDITGRTISTQNTAILRGDNNWEIATQNLSQGVYFISIKMADKIASLKLVKAQ